MTKKKLPTGSDGKISLTLAKHGAHYIRVISPGALPYRLGTQRDLAWRVISLMNNLTVAKAHEILSALEPNIQGKVGRPLGWVVDAIKRGVLEVSQTK